MQAEATSDRSADGFERGMARADGGFQGFTLDVGSRSGRGRQTRVLQWGSSV